MKDLNRWFKAADELPISISIFFECLLSVVKQLDDGIG
jgi:hypothetical protein